MAEQNDKKTKHLRSARQWLTRAEESFDKDHDVRGELNLFLAKAELQHVQETGAKRGWLRPAFRHGLAVIVAVMLVSTAYGLYQRPYDHAASQSAPSPPAGMGSSPVLRPDPAGNNAVSLQPPAYAPSPASVSPAKPVVQTALPQQQAVEKRSEPDPLPLSEQRSPVSSEEMKSLIRAAGKSLRGE